MNKVYGKDYFFYIETEYNTGYIEVKTKKYPFITICNNKTLSTIELDEFLYYNLNRVINYYNKFNMEVKNEFKTSPKRYLAKQNK